MSFVSEVKVRNLGNHDVDQGMDNQVAELNDDFCVFGLKMEPVGWNVMPDMACRVEAGAQV